MPKNIFYSYPVYASFVKNDENLFKSKYKVFSFHFVQTKRMLLFSFIKQFIFLCINAFKTELYISFFAGYSSFLPGVFAFLTGKNHILVLGGTDCSSFPSINYGNFRKPILGWFTYKSIKMATHLAPVDLSLVRSENTFYDMDSKEQGYEVFCKGIKKPYTVINIGYDPLVFYHTGIKEKNSFITLAQMTPANFFRKGIDLIFDMANKFPDCQFTIVGNTPEMKYNSVPNNVNLLPFVKYEDIRSLYSKHEFYLQLSIMEGFPSAPCEAMLCECIPIVSNVAALPNIVGDTGYILFKRDVQELEMLIKNAMVCDKEVMGENARKRIIKLFPTDTRAKLLDLIEVQMK